MRGERNLPVDFTLYGQDSRHEHFGNQIDQSGATYPGGFPFTKDMAGRFEIIAIYPYPVDGSGNGHHSALDHTPLEGRTGGPRTGNKPVAVAQNDLRIGPDIHQDAEFFSAMKSHGQDIGDEVAPKIRTHIRQRDRALHGDGQPA